MKVTTKREATLRAFAEKRHIVITLFSIIMQVATQGNPLRLRGLEIRPPMRPRSQPEQARGGKYPGRPEGGPQGRGAGVPRGKAEREGETKGAAEHGCLAVALSGCGAGSSPGGQAATG